MVIKKHTNWNNSTELNKCQNCDSECNDYKRKNNVLVYHCNKCNKGSNKSIDKLIERYANTYSMCNKDLDKFILLLRKCVYPDEYMNKWSRFNETKNPQKYYSKLNLSNITEEDYVHSQKVWKKIKVKDIGEYHDLYAQTDVLLSPDVFESFTGMSLDICGLDPSRFVSVPDLAWHACLEMQSIKLELLTNIDMLLLLEKGIRGGIYQATIPFIKANNKCFKI